MSYALNLDGYRSESWEDTRLAIAALEKRRAMTEARRRREQTEVDEVTRLLALSSRDPSVQAAGKFLSKCSHDQVIENEVQRLANRANREAGRK